MRDALADPLLRGQGFLPRYLFASPASIAGARLLTAEQLDRTAYDDPRLQRYWARCEDIAATPQAIDHETREVKPPVLPLTDEAKQDWLEFYNEVESEQSSLGKFSNLRPFAGRAGELARRVAAVFACFEGKTEIDEECMCLATAIVRHSLSEWRRYTDSAVTDPLLQQAVALMEWLRDAPLDPSSPLPCSAHDRRFVRVPGDVANRRRVGCSSGGCAAQVDARRVVVFPGFGVDEWVGLASIEGLDDTAVEGPDLNREE